MSRQEPQGILKLPSFSDILQASLLAQTPATGFMDGPVAADRDDMLKLPSLGLAARPGLQVSLVAFIAIFALLSCTSWGYTQIQPVSVLSQEDKVPKPVIAETGPKCL